MPSILLFVLFDFDFKYLYSRLLINYIKVRYKTMKRKDVIMSEVNEERSVENLSVSQQKNIENHLVKAIISTVVCCLPLGIVAIVHATCVNPALRAGDLNAAREASRKANFWGNLSIIIGIVINILYIKALILGVIDE